MNSFWLAVYNFIALPVLLLTLHVVALFDVKARKGVRGRDSLFKELKESLARLNSSPKIWFHSSSLGEFEQAKPLIEELKQKYQVSIIVTFFSPSGYENAKKYPNADVISYIPFDTKAAAKQFISLVSPDVALIMRYDLWPNHINELARLKKKVFLIDATLRDSSLRLKPVLRNFHHYLFEKLTGILTVAQSDLDNFLKFEIDPVKVSVVGDTRFDRVFQNAASAKQRKLIKDDIIKNKKILVAGSTWPEDEEVLIPALKKAFRYRNEFMVILVPHEPNLPHLERLEQEFAAAAVPTLRFSHLNGYDGEKVILVDSIGILLTLYFYADIAFIGGSYKSNVHNVLEAAIFGIPVLYGPKISGSAEAANLASLGGGIICNDKTSFYRSITRLLLNEEIRAQKGNISRDYTLKHLGATEKILRVISPFL